MKKLNGTKNNENFDKTASNESQEFWGFYLQI